MRNPKRPARRAVQAERSGALGPEHRQAANGDQRRPGAEHHKGAAAEHMFTGFMASQRNVYMDVIWSNEIGEAVEAEALAVMNPAVVSATSIATSRTR